MNRAREHSPEKSGDPSTRPSDGLAQEDRKNESSRGGGWKSQIRNPKSEISTSTVGRARSKLWSFQRLLGHGGFALDQEAEAGDATADPDLVAVGEERGSVELLAVDVGAVLAAEVFDGRGGALDEYPGVAARDLGPVDAEVGVDRTADDVGSLGERVVAVLALKLERQ